MSLSNTGAAMVICSTMFGYGIIALPSGCSQVGYIGAILLLLLTAGISFLTFQLIFKASKKYSEQNEIIGESPKVSFFSLSEGVSTAVANITSFVTIIFLFLITITYQSNIILFAGKVIKMTLDKDVPPYILAIAVSVIELGFTFLKDLSVLSSVSYISVGSCLFVACLCIFYASMKPDIPITKMNIKGFSTSFGFYICALSCSPTIPVVFNDLSPDGNTTLVAIYAVLIGTTMCMIIGIAGYFCGGDDMKGSGAENILDYLAMSGTPIRKSISEGSFDKKGVCITIARGLFTLILTISYAFQCYTARLMIIELISKVTGKSPKQKSMQNFKMILGPLYVFLTPIITLKAYSKALLNWNGMIFGNYITFIVPPLCYMGVCGSKNKLWYTISIGIMIFALVTMAYSVWMNFTGES